MSRKTDKRGRSKGSLGSFINIERYIMQSVAWRSLKPLARSAYLEMLYCFDGKNNGQIQMSARIMGERLGMDKASGSRAISELEAKGFVQLATGSLFSQKKKRCSEYRLTAFKCDKSGNLPAKSFLHWKPEIQNSVAQVQRHGCTGATDSLKTTRNSPFQLHRCNHEGGFGGGHGCTGAPLLESNHTPSPQTPPIKAQAGAAIHRASAMPSPDGSDNFAPLKTFAIKTRAHLDRGGPELGAALKRLAGAIDRKGLPGIGLKADFRGKPIAHLQSLEKTVPEKFRAWATSDPPNTNPAQAA